MLCNALNKLIAERDGPLKFKDLSPLASNPDSGKIMNELILHRVDSEIQYIQSVVGRPLTSVEKNTMAWEPRCLAWCVIIFHL